ncbi:hypothetical protein I9W82_000995 [Candida metapsilosis]|uniref:Uncharacterized protein n=1 Tax=Candida metapsilosis TaxID=273372 RepID=A0A8H7ZH09_9ASCO|nr:hypothetical protein I9W82_000995 [Candida metapsilosis]
MSNTNTKETKDSSTTISPTVKKKSTDQAKSSKQSNKSPTAQSNFHPSTSSMVKSNMEKESAKKSSVLTASVTLHSHSHDVVYKIFTYIVIILPTLTSVIFPISTKSVPQNEQIGNFIIDLLTVVLISWIVRFTLEWPYNWMKELETTKTKLLQQLNQDDFAIQHTDKVVLMVRKINTFQIMALVCCLVSSLLSSVLLIWTRKYTIIDQKRKKMVFNNVNIALLQFWSIFRIIITFTDSLQYSSMNDNINPLYAQGTSFQTWFTDLKQYFLPNLTNQILLDHLQVHNKQFDRLKLDLIRLQKELDSRDQAHSKKEKQQQQQQQRQELLAHKSQSKFKQSHLSPPFLLSPQDNSKLEQQVITKSNNSFLPFSLGAPPPPKISPLFSSMQSEIDYSQFAPSPSLHKPHSFSQTPLKTIVEEDDFVFESLEPPSFNRFDQSSHGSSNKTILECTRSVLKSIRSETTISDLFKNPSSVRKVLVTELAFLMNEYKSSDNEIFKVFLMEVVDKYLLGIYVQVMDHLAELLNHPLHHLLGALVWINFKLPLHIIKLYFRFLLMLPYLLVQWFMIKPVKFVALQVSFILRGVISLILLKLTGDCTSQPADASPSKPTNFNSMAKLDKPLTDTTQFTMKQFHLSPVLSKDEYFTKNVDHESRAQAKYKNASLISITPSSTKSSSSNIGNGSRQSLKLNNAALYDD